VIDSLGIGRNSVHRPPVGIIAQQYQRKLYIIEKYFQCTFRRWQCGSIFIRLAVVATRIANWHKIPTIFELTAVRGHPRYQLKAHIRVSISH